MALTQVTDQPARKVLVRLAQPEQSAAHTAAAKACHGRRDSNVRLVESTVRQVEDAGDQLAADWGLGKGGRAAEN